MTAQALKPISIDCYFDQIGGRQNDTTFTILVKNGGDAYLESDTLKGVEDTDDFFVVLGDGSYLKIKSVIADEVQHGSCVRTEGSGALMEIEDSYLNVGHNGSGGEIIQARRNSVIRFLGYTNRMGVACTDG